MGLDRRCWPNPRYPSAFLAAAVLLAIASGWSSIADGAILEYRYARRDLSVLQALLIDRRERSQFKHVALTAHELTLLDTDGSVCARTEEPQRSRHRPWQGHSCGLSLLAAQGDGADVAGGYTDAGSFRTANRYDEVRLFGRIHRGNEWVQGYLALEIGGGSLTIDGYQQWVSRGPDAPAEFETSKLQVGVVRAGVDGVAVFAPPMLKGAGIGAKIGWDLLRNVKFSYGGFLDYLFPFGEGKELRVAGGYELIRRGSDRDRRLEWSDVYGALSFGF